MKKLINSIMAALFAASLASCAMGPTMKMADGSIVTLGGSLMTEASADARSAALANGTNLNWVRGNVNETAVAKTGLMMYGTAVAMTEATKAVVSNNGVKNVAAKEVTKQVGLKEATKQVEIQTASETTLGVEALKAHLSKNIKNNLINPCLVLQ
jgi:hypothetical protein